MTEMTTLDTLKQMRELLTDPNNWYQGTFAGYRNASGSTQAVGSKTLYPSWLNSQVNCWCMLGAGLKVTQAVCLCEPTWEVEIRKTIRNTTIYESIPAFNDDPHTTHADVLVVLDKTIQRLEAQHAAQ